jgi:hypothetical protein
MPRIAAALSTLVFFIINTPLVVYEKARHAGIFPDGQTLPLKKGAEVCSTIFFYNKRERERERERERFR